MKTYRFTVTVKTANSKSSARSALLTAFVLRQPDGCEFRLTEFRKPTPLKWKPLKKKKKDRPTRGFIVAGSYRLGEWTMSSVMTHGVAWWCDLDRTHYCQLPQPPSRKK